MTRRKGVIAALAGIGAAFTVKAQPGEQQFANSGAFSLILQKGPRKAAYSSGCHSAGDSGVFSCDYPDIPEPEYALSVTYGDKTVKLTAQEIMEALESK